MPEQSEYEESMRNRMQQRAGASLLDSGTNPDQAAKTLKNSVDQGVPFAYGNLDPDAFNQEAQNGQNARIIQQSTPVQRYLAEHDFAAPISHDDLPALNKAAGAIQDFVTDSLFFLPKHALKALPDIKDIAEAGIKGLVEAPDRFAGVTPPSEQTLAALQSVREFMSKAGESGIFGLPSGEKPTPEQIELEVQRLQQRFQRGEALQSIMFSLPQIVFSPLLGLFRSEVSRPLEEHSGIPAEVTEGYAMVLGAALGLKGAHPRTAEVYRQSREPPSPGVDQVVDKGMIEDAKVKNEELQKVQAALEDSKTRDRSSEATRAFVESAAPGREIGIPVDAIVEILGDKAEEQFSWLPDFLERMGRANETGGDVRIPLGDWLAAPEELQKALKEDIRVRDNGLTLREAAELDKSPPEAYADPNVPETKERAARRVAKTEAWLKPLFDEKTFKRFMPQGDFNRYSRLLEKEDAAAEEKALAKAEREAKARLTPEWQENRANVEKEVTSNLENRRDFRVDKFLRTKQTGMFASGKVPKFMVKLDRDAIPAKFNQLMKRYSTEKGGVNPDDVALLHGYNSGREMLNDLLTLDNRRGEQQPAAFFRGVVKDNTDRLMEERYGNLKDNILAEARENVGTGGMADLLAEEMFMLAPRDLPRPFTRALLDQKIKDHFNALRADEVDVGRFVRDAGQAGRRAESALLKDDVPEAFRSSTT